MTQPQPPPDRWRWTAPITQLACQLTLLINAAVTLWKTLKGV